jgi:hypothetical protein
VTPTRPKLLRRGLWLAIATVAWNVIEGVIALAAGMLSNSSAVVVGWRLGAELRRRSAERAERA